VQFLLGEGGESDLVKEIRKGLGHYVTSLGRGGAAEASQEVVRKSIGFEVGCKSSQMNRNRGTCLLNPRLAEVGHDGEALSPGFGKIS